MGEIEFVTIFWDNPRIYKIASSNIDIKLFTGYIEFLFKLHLLPTCIFQTLPDHRKEGNTVREECYIITI